jgi:hypothetical protein
MFERNGTTGLFLIILAMTGCTCLASETTNAGDVVESAVMDAPPAEEAEGNELYGRVRYTLILDREPFGSEPLLDQDVKQDAAAVKELETNYRLCFLLEGEQSGDIRAGFQNVKAKKGEPKSVMLRIGESFGAMKLLDIDLPNSSATLQYKGKELSFTLTRPKAGTAAKPAPTPPAEQPQRRFGGGFRRTTPPEPAQQPAPQPEPQPQLTPEEMAIQREQVQQNLREYQMEVLRQGMPPLPVQLTPEQDAQLVDEGVLPPLEDGEQYVQ